MKGVIIMNMFTITGRVSDVEVKTASNGTKYARFSIMHFTRGKDGYTKGYFNITAFGTTAERLSNFKRGSPLEFIGHFRFNTYDAPDGTTKKRIENVADNFYPCNEGAYSGKQEEVEE